MKTLLSFCLAFLPCLLFAQNGMVKGTVKDNQNAPAPYANVVLLFSKDSAMVKGNFTDDNGIFSFDNISPGDYRVAVSQMGMKKYYSEKFTINEINPVKNFGDIKLEEASTTLKEVTVSSTIPLFERKPDRTVVNVASDQMAGSSTAMDILAKSPGVVVDKDGNISMRGKTGVLVMVDGKPTYLSSEQLAALLTNMSAEQIDQIELITNPSARYDAAGAAGIINIKLKKSKLYGTNGNASLNYIQGVYNRETGNLTFNNRSEKFNVFGNYNGSDRNNFNDIYIKRRFRKNGEIDNIFDQHTWLKTHETDNSVKAGADYFINDNNTIGVVLNGNTSPEKHWSQSFTGINNRAGNLSSAVNTDYTSLGKFTDYSVNANYESKLDTSGTQLNVDADYAAFDIRNRGNYIYTNYDSVHAPSAENAMRNFTSSGIRISSAKADFVAPFRRKWKVETGVKSSIINTDNDVTYYNIISGADILDPTKTNHFKYGENIYAGYTTLRKEWSKLAIQGGLRGEQTVAKGYQQVNDSAFTRSYFKLFPSGTVSYNASANHQWGISYGRRIDRPSYQDMNPFRFFLDPYTYDQGNPFLRPQFSNNYELSYTYRQFLSGVFSYSRTRDNITEITRQNDSLHVTYINKENLDITDNYSFTASVSAPLAKWLITNTSFNAFYLYFDSPFSGGMLNRGMLSYVFNTSNQIPLNHGFSAQADFRYNSAMQYALFRIKPTYGLSLSVQKKVLHDRGKIKLSVQNIIRNRYMQASVNYQNMDFDFRQRRDNQFISLSFSYKFGKTTIASSRRHNTGADEEKDRVKKGN